MGKILKRLTTIALAAVMLFGTMTTAFAADENEGITVNNNKKGSITIHKYKMPDTENAFESNTESGGTALSEDKLPKTAVPLPNVQFKITRVVQNENGEWVSAEGDLAYSAEAQTDKDGEITFGKLNLGRYKIEELGIDGGDGSNAVLPNEADDAMAGKAFFVDVPMTEADGKTLNYDVHVYPKNEVLSIEKDVTYVGNKHDSFNMNEEQTWIINTAIPGNIALKKDSGSDEYNVAQIYEVVDKIDSQLTYKKYDENGEVVVQAVTMTYGSVDGGALTKDTDYNVQIPSENNGNTLKVSLTDAGKVKLKKLINLSVEPAAFLQIQFKTVINETAKTGEAIYNGADLNFTNVAGSETVTVSVPEDQRPEVHTGRISVKKVGEKVDGAPLEGVEFMIFDTLENAQAAVEVLQNNNPVEDIKGALEVYDPNQTKYTTIVRTNSDGVAEFKGLAYYTNKANETGKVKGDNEGTGEKTYYIVEIKTVKGYQLPSKYFEVKVNQTSSVAADPTETIVNVKPSKLPAAGGRGTIIFTAVGLTVMAAAGIIILMSRKKKDR
ncbi:SpaH/EbpB family LPXTG-anchored major pilin [Mediterraneibacter sp.]|jgi:LPXTG-motif cell wall-anchored protein|uniref:SpaH/EbpB family LPXTG-anchored major pilin n=1 Tax=Mediterraneibacter sp. TaxID=2316022 RepID=UPI0027BA4BD2|nr:SpaH/EbpB family LPXTG-anchored major pilin [Mediterraneibacter sp.]